MDAYIITGAQAAQIADAIRLKAQTDVQMDTDEMVAAILGLKLENNEGMDHMIMRDLEEVRTDTATYVASNVFNENRLIKSVWMPNVTSIGEYAFYGCENLEDVEFGELDSLGPYAFYGCENLKTADLSESRIRTLHAGTFEYSGITMLKLPQDVYCSLINASAFYGTVLSSDGGTGGIVYVPLRYRVQYEANNQWADVFRNEHNIVINY